ncbi:MAG: hypothetical protein K6F78_10490 [Bacteroidaceae bacterium]|nr:hypothetical protein [Bacteroidaceae bacterium]
MKRFINILIASLMLMACQKESEPQSLTPQLFVNEVQKLGNNKYFLSGSYDPEGKEIVNKATFYYGTTEEMDQSITANLSGRTATIILEGLEAGTTYYYCLEIGNGADSRRSKLRSFTTEGTVTNNTVLKNANLIKAVEKQLGRSFQKETNGQVSLSNEYNQRLAKMLTWIDLSDLDDPTVCDEIGYFISLQTLACSRNDIVTLDLSKNTSLKELWCEGDDVYEANDIGENEWKGKSGILQNLILPKTATLREIHIDGHMLQSIDVSGCPNLTILNCPFGALLELDLTHNSFLQELRCESNLLNKLDLSGNAGLTWLQCQNNYLVSLDITKQTKLINVECGGSSNLISEIDLSKNAKLENFSCYLSQLTKVDFSQLPNLKYVDLNVNKIEKLDLSHNPKLEFLNCQYGPLTELDLSHNPKLNHLECHGCKFTSLDLSNNHELSWLQCYENNMTELDVSMIADNADIMAGNQWTTTGQPLTLTLYVNKAQYGREPNTGPYYMGLHEWQQKQQDRVNVVLKE